MKRFLGFSLAMFFALMAIALVGGDSGAVAGHGCHGKKCHGGLFARHHRCNGREKCNGLFGRKNRCNGEKAAEECGACESACDSCDSCGEVVEGCSSCGGEVVSGGCPNGDCGGEGVIISEPATAAAPTEAPAAPAST